MGIKVVYAITCHRVTNPLIHTVNYLSSFEDNTILIHVDAKSDLNDFVYLENENVFLISERVPVTWGDKTFTDAIIKLMQYSLKFEYDFFFLLSGDDIPLRTNQELKSFLKKYYDYNFLDFDPNADSNHIYERVIYSYPKYYYDRNHNLKNSIRKRFFKVSRNVFYKNKLFKKNSYRMPKLYKGSNWFSLKRETVEYILKYLSQNKWLLEVFENSFASDESIFHSIFMTNPDFKIFDGPIFGYANSSLRYIDWRSGPDFPKVLDNKDAVKMKDSLSFFARKIKPDASKEFMESFLVDD